MGGDGPIGGGTIWLGVDDTDGPDGGCTTHVLTEILRVARQQHVDLIGEPRLVRLNPNIPWKTRGNAALSARFGVGRGPRERIGRLPEGPVWSYRSGSRLDRATATEFRDAAWETVRNGRREGPETQPALVTTDHPLPPSFYWDAVRSVVRLAEVRRRLQEAGAEVRTDGPGRGLIGAGAAIAWPGRRRTWELIAYREPGRIGSPRQLEPETVRAAARRFPSLFLCHDEATRRILVAPHTDCPILVGLRSTDRAVLPAAWRTLKVEPADRWVIFRTNQASGDHLIERPIGAVAPYEPAILRGTVAEPPVTLPGGHVRFELTDGGDAVTTCLAFEPTKTLPRAARELRPGDRLTVWGGRGRDATFRLEGLRPEGFAMRPEARAPPRCPQCERSTRSLGSGRGYRCPTCRRRFPPEAALLRAAPTGLPLGTAVQPTPSARRHLHPLTPPPRGPIYTGPL